MIKLVTKKEYNELQKTANEALRLAITHDPDHGKMLRDLTIRVETIERQMERLGAPQYRVVSKGKAPIPLKRKK
jgi:hypothetical protein